MADLSVSGLYKYFGERKLFDGLEFELFRGEHAALIGPNGSGKTTLFKIIAGECPHDGGTVHIDPVITNDPEADRLYVLASRLLTSIDTRLSVHDFHVAPYQKGRKIYFEVACPEDFAMSDRELRRAFLRNFLVQSPNDRAVIRLDHHFC